MSNNNIYNNEWYGVVEIKNNNYMIDSHGALIDIEYFLYYIMQLIIYQYHTRLSIFIFLFFYLFTLYSLHYPPIHIIHYLSSSYTSNIYQDSPSKFITLITLFIITSLINLTLLTFTPSFFSLISILLFLYKLLLLFSIYFLAILTPFLKHIPSLFSSYIFTLILNPSKIPTFSNYSLLFFTIFFSKLVSSQWNDYFYVVKLVQ